MLMKCCAKGLIFISIYRKHKLYSRIFFKQSPIDWLIYFPQVTSHIKHVMYNYFIAKFYDFPLSIYLPSLFLEIAFFLPSFPTF